MKETATVTFERVLNTEEAPALLQIHPKTLQKMAREGTVPAFRIGDLWRFRCLLTVLTGEAAALATDCHERKVHRIPMPKMQDADSCFAAERLEALAEQIANRVVSKLSSLSRMERPAENSTLK